MAEPGSCPVAEPVEAHGIFPVAEPAEAHCIFPVAEPVEALTINLTLRQAQGPEIFFPGG